MPRSSTERITEESNPAIDIVSCAATPLVWRVSDAAPKKTPLYDEHVRLGAKMIPFGGWLMPVQYSSIMEEHQAVRNNVGVFDISHMGQLIVDGAGAGEWLNTMLTNNIAKLEVGTGQYTFLLNDGGGIIDDLIVYRIGQEKFLLVVNASRIDDDFAWLQICRAPLPRRRTGRAARSHQSQRRFWRSCHSRPAGRASFSRAVWRRIRIFRREIRSPIFRFDGTNVSVARTGYTGEDGIEVFFRATDAAKFWNDILEKGNAVRN